MKFSIGVIRVLTTADSHDLNIHGDILKKYFPCFDVESRCIQDQPAGIHDEQTKRISVPKIIELAKQFAHKDSIIVSCAEDPGVEELKKIYTMPVIGVGNAVSLLSSPKKNKVGVIGITKIPPMPYVENMGDSMIDLGIPENVLSTLDLATEKGRKGCIKKAKELKAAGAQIIAPACTGFSTVGLASELESLLGIPVLDPIICAGTIAYFELVRKL